MHLSRGNYRGMSPRTLRCALGTSKVGPLTSLRRRLTRATGTAPDKANCHPRIGTSRVLAAAVAFLILIHRTGYAGVPLPRLTRKVLDSHLHAQNHH